MRRSWWERSDVFFSSLKRRSIVSTIIWSPSNEEKERHPRCFAPSPGTQERKKEKENLILITKFINSFLYFSFFSFFEAVRREPAVGLKPMSSYEEALSLRAHSWFLSFCLDGGSRTIDRFHRSRWSFSRLKALQELKRKENNGGNVRIHYEIESSHVRASNCFSLRKACSWAFISFLRTS